MSTIKYKMNELSRDLGVKPQEISSLLNKAFGKEEPKSVHTAVLNEDEINYVFDHYIQMHASTDMKAFFDYCAEVSAKEAKEQKPQPKRKLPKKRRKPKKLPKNSLRKLRTSVKRKNPSSVRK